jgi:hypothetical protein
MFKYINIDLIILICQPKFTIHVAPCFVSLDNRSLVGILHNNGNVIMRSSIYTIQKGIILHGTYAAMVSLR